MAARIIDGTAVAAGIRQEIKKKVAQIRKEKQPLPGLAIVVVESPRARVNISQLKKRICDSVGIFCHVFSLHPLTTQLEVIELIQVLNKNPRITGINIHPMPNHINYHAVVRAMDPAKDVEGVHPQNLGDFLLGNSRRIPFTPSGVLKLIETTGEEIAGKRAVVIGRSLHAGLPIGLLLMEKDATVSFAHSRSWYLEDLTKTADILVVATGHPEMINGDMIKPGAVVIDIGSNFVGGQMVGDVEHSTVKQVAGWITPVTGGAGPMTMSMMLMNLLECCNE